MYSDEKNALIIVSLLKKHNVKKIVISPGATNIPISGSLQNDPFFELYSAPDERSAAYMACGLSQESGEIVAISCTGATSSRNYFPGLTEAYYRKLPIIAITSSNGTYDNGNLIAQNIDRTTKPKDAVKISVDIPVIKDEQDVWYTNLQVNRAILEATRNGGGPVHINVTTSLLGTFTTKYLPNVSKINRFYSFDKELPLLSNYKKIVIFIGSHKLFTEEEQENLQYFCEKFNAVVLKDHTSGYNGKYSVQSAIATRIVNRNHKYYSELIPDLIIHIGEISGDYPTLSFLTSSSAPVWRVSEDGELRDTFKKLNNVFQMNFTQFSNKYKNSSKINGTYKELWEKKVSEIRKELKELPFSNNWIANNSIDKLDESYVLHLGILNSLRSWNWFELPKNIRRFSNVGGFGIDGILSTAIGSALASPDKNHLVVIGDLAFFYDMNSLGNRYLPSNLKIILVNNGTGTEFRNFDHIGSQFGKQTDDFIAAGGHYVNHFDKNESKISPAEAWTKSLGFKYYRANSKMEFLSQKDDFFNNSHNRPSIIECITSPEEESEGLEDISKLNQIYNTRGTLVSTAKKFLSVKSINKIKKFSR